MGLDPKNGHASFALNNLLFLSQLRAAWLGIDVAARSTVAQQQCIKDAQMSTAQHTVTNMAQCHCDRDTASATRNSLPSALYKARGAHPQSDA